MADNNRNQSMKSPILFLFSSSLANAFYISVPSSRLQRCCGCHSFPLAVVVVSSDHHDDDDATTLNDPPSSVQVPFDDYEPLDEQEMESLTLSQLKQQLRLRGLKVSGRKQELVDRLMGRRRPPPLPPPPTTQQESSVVDVEPELVDVSEFVDEQDQGKDYKSVQTSGPPSSPYPEASNNNNNEVWGTEARIVDDYEGRKLVVDSLTQNVIEFVGSGQTMVQAYCVASRDALQPFMMGTTTSTTTTNNSTKTQAEERLFRVQTQREQASKRPVHWEDESGIDEGDETGIFANILHRDFSDWGKYTATGAQLSATEVQGVLLLSDVYGPFTDDTKALAEKIAFECQPVVVMVPDLFRGKPWTGPEDGVNSEGQRYEEWRAGHSDLRVNVDIRAAAACLRERYGVSSVVVWGTCYGGGRALEAASGWFPNQNVHDVDGSVGPPPVDPMVAVAWYPTRYDAKELFGKLHKGRKTDRSGEARQVAVMAVFAGDDTIPGATKDDSIMLKRLLEQDARVKDLLVKVFPGQKHGFAHCGISRLVESDGSERFIDEEFGGAGRVISSGGRADVACLLSTAFMETYSRVFLPTVGPPINFDEHERSWSKSVEMMNLDATRDRDVRQELSDRLDNFVEEPLGGFRMDPSDESQEEELKRLLRSMQDSEATTGPYAIEDGDDLSTIYAKLTASDADFQIF